MGRRCVLQTIRSFRRKQMAALVQRPARERGTNWRGFPRGRRSRVPKLVSNQRSKLACHRGEHGNEIVELCAGVFTGNHKPEIAGGRSSGVINQRWIDSGLAQGSLERLGGSVISRLECDDRPGCFWNTDAGLGQCLWTKRVCWFKRRRNDFPSRIIL